MPHPRSNISFTRFLLTTSINFNYTGGRGNDLGTIRKNPEIGFIISDGTD